MNTQTFLSSLYNSADKPLVFDYGAGRVQPGYHVTEIKATTVQAVDCGEQGNNWTETILQLWAPEKAKGETYMRVEKFLGIYHRVASSIPIVSTAEVRVEYGAVGAPAINYLVRAVETEGEAVVVRLEAPAVACKGADRSLGDIPVLNSANGVCCTPSLESRACCA